MQILTVKEYARKRGITGEAVRKQLRKGKKPKGVKSFKQYGKIYLLTIK